MATYAGAPTPSAMGERYPATPPNPNSPTNRVDFRLTPQEDDYQGLNKKYLTAKYPQHQMRLIRKRLEVEDWVDKALRDLYDKAEPETYDCEIDLDELLDIEDTTKRWQFLEEKVADVKKKKSPEVVNKFIEELLQKAETL